MFPQQKPQLKDDTVKKRRVWNPPYQFVIGRYVKWNPEEVEIILFIEDPSYAYAAYSDMVKAAKGVIKDEVFVYFLRDSFDKDCVEFCKKMYETEIKKLKSSVI